MLRLLAQREEGYEDIAALMGLSVDGVRAKVKEALAEIGEAERPAVEPPQPAPPKPPEPPEPRRAPEQPEAPPPTRPPKPGSSLLSRLSLPADRGRLIGGGVGAAVVVVLVVLVATGAFGGGDSEPSADAGAGGGSSDAASTTAADSGRVTQAVLEPVAGGDASGRVLFGRIDEDVVLQVEAEGLDPSPRGQSYTVWLYRSPKLVLRVGAVKVDGSGGIAAQLPIPAELLTHVASGTFDQIDISLTSDAVYKAEVAQARKQERLPAYTGTSVLRGKITGPAVKAASGKGGG